MTECGSDVPNFGYHLETPRDGYLEMLSNGIVDKVGRSHSSQTLGKNYHGFPQFSDQNIV